MINLRNRGLHKFVSALIAFLFLVNSAARGEPLNRARSNDNLSPALRTVSPEFKELVRMKEFLLEEDAADKYISDQIARELDLMGEKRWKNERTEIFDLNDPDKRGNIQLKVQGLRYITFVKVSGLFSHTRQIAHVGLSGKEYGGQPVAYIDSRYYHTLAGAVKRHEADEILQWEYFRTKILGIGRGEMRKWIEKHINTADANLNGTKYEGLSSRAISKIFHDSSYPIRLLYNSIGLDNAYFDYAYIADMLDIYRADKDSKNVNISANDGKVLNRRQFLKKAAAAGAAAAGLSAGVQATSSAQDTLFSQRLFRGNDFEGLREKYIDLIRKLFPPEMRNSLYFVTYEWMQAHDPGRAKGTSQSAGHYDHRYKRIYVIIPDLPGGVMNFNALLGYIGKNEDLNDISRIARTLFHEKFHYLVSNDKVLSEVEAKLKGMRGTSLKDWRSIGIPFLRYVLQKTTEELDPREPSDNKAVKMFRKLVTLIDEHPGYKYSDAQCEEAVAYILGSFAWHRDLERPLLNMFSDSPHSMGEAFISTLDIDEYARLVNLLGHLGFPDTFVPDSMKKKLKEDSPVSPENKDRGIFIARMVGEKTGNFSRGDIVTENISILRHGRKESFILVPTKKGEYFVINMSGLTTSRLPVVNPSLVRPEYIPGYGWVIFTVSSEGQSSAFHVSSMKNIGDYRREENTDSLKRDILWKLKRKYIFSEFGQCAGIYRWIEGPMPSLKERMVVMFETRRKGIGEDKQWRLVRYDLTRWLKGIHWIYYADWMLSPGHTSQSVISGNGFLFKNYLMPGKQRVRSYAVGVDLFWNADSKYPQAEAPLQLVDNEGLNSEDVPQSFRRQQNPVDLKYAEACLAGATFGRAMAAKGLFPGLGQGKIDTATTEGYLVVQMMILEALKESVINNGYVPPGLRTQNYQILISEIKRVRTLLNQTLAGLEANAGDPKSHKALECLRKFITFLDNGGIRQSSPKVSLEEGQGEGVVTAAVIGSHASPEDTQVITFGRGTHKMSVTGSQIKLAYARGGYFGALKELRISPYNYYKAVQYLHEPAYYLTLTYEEAARYITEPPGRRLRGLFTSRATARNFILVVLDTIPGFRSARERGDIKAMADLYKTNVINYVLIKKAKGRFDGQISFFIEKGLPITILSSVQPYFKKKYSAAECLRLAIPEIIDLRNPDALDPLEIENYYWTDIENARYHILQALYTIRGFKKAYKQKNIKVMAGLYLRYVMHYKAKGQVIGGQAAFFCEVGGLSGLLLSPPPCCKKKNSPGALVSLTIDGLVDDGNPDALKTHEVERTIWVDERAPVGNWDDPANARRCILQTLYTIAGFEKAHKEGDIKKMAELYRDNVIKYRPKNTQRFKHGGQFTFFCEVGKLSTLMTKDRDYFEKSNSPAELLRLAIDGLIDPANPDALDPIEVEHYYWNDSKNAIYHVLRTLHKIKGFKDAHEKNNIALMAQLYRDNVIEYQAKDLARCKHNGQQAFFIEEGGLGGLLSSKLPYLAKSGSPAELVRLAIPKLIDENNPDALQPVEVERPWRNSPSSNTPSDFVLGLIGKYAVRSITQDADIKRNGKGTLIIDAFDIVKKENVTLNVPVVRAAPYAFSKFRRTGISGIDYMLGSYHDNIIKDIFYILPNEYGIDGIGMTNILAVSESLKDNNIALFHEVAHGALHARKLDFPVLMRNISGGEAALDEYVRAEGKEHRLHPDMKAHYALRLFQKQKWPKDDEALTALIKKSPRTLDEGAVESETAVNRIKRIRQPFPPKSISRSSKESSHRIIGSYVSRLITELGQHGNRTVTGLDRVYDVDYCDVVDMDDGLSLVVFASRRVDKVFEMYIHHDPRARDGFDVLGYGLHILDEGKQDASLGFHIFKEYRGLREDFAAKFFETKLRYLYNEKNIRYFRIKNDQLGASIYEDIARDYLESGVIVFYVKKFRFSLYNTVADAAFKDTLAADETFIEDDFRRILVSNPEGLYLNLNHSVDKNGRNHNGSDILNAIRWGWSPDEIAFHIQEDMMGRNMKKSGLPSLLIKMALLEPEHFAKCQKLAELLGGDVWERFQDALVPHDTVAGNNTLCVMDKVLPSAIKDGRAYTITYDSKRLRENLGQAARGKNSTVDELVNAYVELLKKGIGNDNYDDIIKLEDRPTSEKVERALISVTCYKDISRTAEIGSSSVNIQGEIKGLRLDITGMINIAFAASNIPNNTPVSELPKYKDILDLVNELYKALTGKQEPPQNIWNIILENIEPIPLDRLDEYYRLNIQELRQAA